MRKRETNIKQHYIPQLYLRNFCDSEGYLHVLNYVKDKKYTVGCHKESYEKYFHDINLKLFNHIIQMEADTEEIVDDFIRVNHENIVGNILSTIPKLFSQENISDCLRIENNHLARLIEFILIHIIRTPQYREKINYLSLNIIVYYGIDLDELGVDELDILPTIHNLLLYGLVSKISHEKNRIGTRYDGFFGHILDELFIIYEQLQEASIRFILNKSSMPLITSPNPVNVVYDSQNHIPFRGLIVPMNNSGRVFETGNASRIERVYLPLSNDVGIMYFDKSFAIKHSITDKVIQVIEEKDIDVIHNLNLSMASKSPDKVYSNSDDFKVLQDMIKNKSSVSIRIFQTSTSPNNILPTSSA